MVMWAKRVTGGDGVGPSAGFWESGTGYWSRELPWDVARVRRTERAGRAMHADMGKEQQTGTLSAVPIQVHSHVPRPVPVAARRSYRYRSYLRQWGQGAGGKRRSRVAAKGRGAESLGLPLIPNP